MGQKLSSWLPEPYQWQVDESVIASLASVRPSPWSLDNDDGELPIWNQTGYASVASGPLPSEIHSVAVEADATGT